MRRRKFSELTGMYNGLIGDLDAKEVWEMRRQAHEED